MKRIKLTKNPLEFLKRQKESFKKKFAREPKHYDYSTNITSKKLIDIIVEASTKAGIDSYKTLRLFEFTDKEIEEYFNRIRHRANT